MSLYCVCFICTPHKLPEFVLFEIREYLYCILAATTIPSLTWSTSISPRMVESLRMASVQALIQLYNNNNIIITAFNGAIQDCLQSPHCASNRLQHVRSTGSSAIMCKSHRALIMCNMLCYVPHGTKGQLSY